MSDTKEKKKRDAAKRSDERPKPKRAPKPAKEPETPHFTADEVLAGVPDRD